MCVEVEVEDGEKEEASQGRDEADEEAEQQVCII